MKPNNQKRCSLVLDYPFRLPWPTQPRFDPTYAFSTLGGGFAYFLFSSYSIVNIVFQQAGLFALNNVDASWITIRS